MDQPKQPRISLIREAIFMVILHAVVLAFYAIDRRNPQIETVELVYFLHLAGIAFLINYFLLPRLLYPKRYLLFAGALVVLIAGSVAMEELVLEQIYFPDTRGTTFPGLFYTLLGILPVITVLTGFKFGWDALWKQQEVETLREAVRESELQFLKSQINPHFLFNNLNNLYAHAIEGSEKTPEIILELSDVLRYMLYDCKAEYVSLKKELEHLENFIRISELQIGERGKVTFDAKTVGGDFRIAPLILIVFVENAFKHSTSSQSDQIHIEVSLDVSASGRLQFHCQNSFREDSNVEELSKGIGLANVRKRLELLYPGKHELKVGSTGTGTYEVVLEMQLDQP
jgi:two-component system LytT family sensor kinase